MPTIAQIITRGDLSVPLSANYNAKQAMYSPALAAPNSPVLIAMVTDALRWANDRPEIYTQNDLLQIADYLIWLTGKFGLQAANTTGGGGSVTPITPGSGGNVNRIDFIVNGSSVIAEGEDTVTFPQFIGYNIDFVRGGVSQSTVNTEDSYFTFNKTTGEFVCVPAAVASELFSIIPT